MSFPYCEHETKGDVQTQNKFSKKFQSRDDRECRSHSRPFTGKHKKVGSLKEIKAWCVVGRDNFLKNSSGRKEDMMKREEGCGGRGRGMGQQETVETSFFNKLVFTATTMPEYCLKQKD